MKAVRSARARCAGRVSRFELATAGPPNGTEVDEATLHFRALCDGLAGLELGGTIPSDAGDRLWRAGLGTLIRGFAAP